MNQKIMGIIPLMIAMLFVAAFAVGDNQAAAASNTATQTVTVGVPETVALTVQDVTWNVDLADMEQSGATTTDSPSFNIANTGNTPINVYVKATSGTFTDSVLSKSFTPTSYKIKSYTGSTFVDIPLSPADQGQQVNTAGGKIAKGTSFDSNIELVIPEGTEKGTYTNVLTYTALNN